MKQRILVAAASLVLAALILLLLPAAPNGPGVSTGPTGPGLPSSSDNQPVTSTTQPAAPGVVRLYGCDDDVLAVFTELASEYTALTGVEVVVLCHEPDGCQATLQRYMESEDPPTMLCVHSQSQLKDWQDTLLDLNDTALAAALCNDGLGMRLNGKLLGIPMEVEGYGLLFNAELLGKKAAYTREGIQNLTDLKIVSQILKNNSVKAFPAAAFASQDVWYLLMNEDLQSARSFIDLYLANCSKTGDSMTLFLNGKAAFYLGGTWDYDTLASFTDATLDVRNLDILPNYAAGAMQYLCSTVWCVNASARQEDIDATLAFLSWMVTAGEETPAPVDQLQKLSPFTDAAWYGNWLENKLRGYMQAEAAVLHWKDADLVGNRLLPSLAVYMADNTNENWEQLRLAVDMVKAEYGYLS